MHLDKNLTSGSGEVERPLPFQRVEEGRDGLVATDVELLP